MTWFPGEALTIRMWETIEKGIGSLIYPWHVKRERRAEAIAECEKLLLTAATASTIASLDYGSGSLPFKTLGMSGSNAALSDLQENLLQNLPKNHLVRLLKHELNVAKAVAHAADEIEGMNKDAPKESVDEDWLFRWRESAGSVSKEQMQQLWGKLLAGEISKPGSFSLRTLDALRNISQKDAEKIELVAPLVCGKNYLFKSKRNREFGLSLENVLELESLNIVTGAAAEISTKLTQKDGLPMVIGVGSDLHVVGFQEKKGEFSVAVPCIHLTEIGMEISNLVQAPGNIEYARELAREIKPFLLEVFVARHDQSKEFGVLEYDDGSRVEAGHPAYKNLESMLGG